MDMQNSDTLILSQHLCHSIAEQEILKDVNINIQTRTVTGLLGPNGSGKTTLLKLLSGIFVPTKGEIKIKKTTTKGIIFQNTDQNLIPWKTTTQNILLPHFREKRSIQDSLNEKAFTLLSKFDLKDTHKKYPRELSGGQKQIVSILRWLIKPPDILFIDEGWSMLDVVQKDRIHNLIKQINTESHTTIFIVSHSPSELARLCDRVYLLSNSPGEIVDLIEFDKSISVSSNEVLLWEKANQVFPNMPKASYSSS
jgi:ABC-type nitrate/sulfonate/bicarbonate transport system ATPase subunit